MNEPPFDPGDGGRQSRSQPPATIRPRWRPTSRRLRFNCGLAALGVLLSACASTQIDRTGTPLDQPLCRPGAAPLSTRVYWGAQWRTDQKEPELRAAAALRGIQHFLGHTPCLAVAGVHRLDPAAAVPTDAELLRLAGEAAPSVDRVLAIVVRELGPRLVIGGAALVEGGTEVVIDLRVLDGRSLDGRSAPLLADLHMRWRHGGAGVLKGVSSLDRNMSAALAATLSPGPNVDARR